MVPSMAFAATPKSSPAKVSLKTAKISKTYVYNAKNQTPTIKVNGKTLVLGTDFKVTSGTLTHKAAGTYKVTITGKGKYTGKKTITYKISPKKVTATAKVSNVKYTGKAKAVKPVVKTKSGTTLKLGRDYTVSGNKHAGVGKYKITIKGKGNYSFTKTVYYRVQRSVSAVKASATSKTYTGKAQSATVAVKLNGKTLKKGTDYTVSGDTKVTNAGKYKITIKGEGNYTGKKTITYTVKKAKQSVVKASVNAETKKITVSGVKGKAKVTYSTNNNKVKISNGKIVVGKNVKKGTKVTISVKVASTKNYSAITKKLTYIVK